MELCTWSTSGSSAPLHGRSTRGVSALGRGESTFGSTAPGRATDYLLYIRGENFQLSGAENPPLELLRPSEEQIFFSIYREKVLCARARRIHLWIHRARARNRFSSLYRRENFLRSGAENPPLDLPRPDFLRSGAENPHLDLPRPSAETIFFLYTGEKVFCARARRIHIWIYRAQARKRYFFSI